MKRYLLIFLILIVLPALGYFIYKAYTFTIFDAKISKIAEIEAPDKPYQITVVYLPSNVSSQGYIQIRKLENKEVLQNYERYNFVNDYKLFNDTLRLVLSDTSFLEKKVDTVFFILP